MSEYTTDFDETDSPGRCYACQTSAHLEGELCVSCREGDHLDPHPDCICAEPVPGPCKLHAPSLRRRA